MFDEGTHGLLIYFCWLSLLSTFEKLFLVLKKPSSYQMDVFKTNLRSFKMGQEYIAPPNKCYGIF